MVVSGFVTALGGHVVFVISKKTRLISVLASEQRDPERAATRGRSSTLGHFCRLVRDRQCTPRARTRGHSWGTVGQVQQQGEKHSQDQGENEHITLARQSKEKGEKYWVMSSCQVGKMLDLYFGIRG